MKKKEENTDPADGPRSQNNPLVTPAHYSTGVGEDKCVIKGEGKWCV